MDRRFRSAAIATALAAAVLAVPASAAAKTKTKKTVTVYAGGPVAWATQLQNRYGAGVDNFLINRVTINVGDTVDWNGDSRYGGFHTVDIPAKGGQDLPLIVPTGGLVSGVNDAAGNPFWFNGKVPNLGFNPALFGGSGGTTYDGTSRVDSGLPTGSPADFKVTFMKAGTYRYFCDVHPGMVGYVVVRPAGQAVPNAKRDANVLKAEEQHYVAVAKNVDKTKAKKNSVSVGASGPGGVEVFAMFPSTLTVKKGTTVRFAMSKFSREVHTASFGPSLYLKTLSDSFQSPAPSPIAINPSDPPGNIVLTSTSHGNGFASTGIMDQDTSTPNPSSQTITFNELGTYHYQCLIHSFMHGTIVVK